MNTRDPWPLPAETPDWWANWKTLTPEQIDALADAYQREQIASAQSEQAFAANQQEYAR